MNSIDDMPLFIYTTNLNLRKEIETLEEPLLAAWTHSVYDNETVLYTHRK